LHNPFNFKHLTLNHSDEMEATSTVAARMERIKLLDGGLRLRTKPGFREHKETYGHLLRLRGGADENLT